MDHQCDFCGKLSRRFHGIGDNTACSVCYFTTMRGDREECECEWTPTPGEVIVVDDPTQGFYNCPICGGKRNLGTHMGYDPITKPPHYIFGDYEVIDILRAWLTANDCNGYESFLWSSMQQYLFRYKKKRGKEDLKKAEFYLKKLIGEYDE